MLGITPAADERWHQTLKNRILLKNYFLPGDLEAQVAALVEHYNYQRYHESLDNLVVRRSPPEHPVDEKGPKERLSNSADLQQLGLPSVPRRLLLSIDDAPQ